MSGLRLAPDGRPRPHAPFGRGPLAAHVLRRVIGAAVGIGSKLPASVAHGLACAGGTLEWALRPGKRDLLARNIAHAVERDPADPLVRALVRREVLNEARRSADLLWALGRRDELRRTTRVDGRENIAAALAPGRGMILTSMHVGGWEVATAIPAAVVPVPTTAIVQDDWLAWAVDPYRSEAGLGLLYRTEPALRAIRLLGAGECVLILGEAAYENPRGYPVRFLDGTARLPAGVASLSRLTGAPIVPFTVLPEGPRRWVVTLETPLFPPPRSQGQPAERDLLQALADRWSAVIRAHPEHWAAVYEIDWVREDA